MTTRSSAFGVLIGLSTVMSGVCAATNARASPYVVTIEQDGASVVAISDPRGDFDLSGLLFEGSDFPTTPAVIPDRGLLFLSPDTSADAYNLLFGPSTFGTGFGTSANRASGPETGIWGTRGLLVVPEGYVSGTSLAVSEDVWDNATLASLGITPGIYTWMWGDAPDQRFEIDVRNFPSTPATPLPATLPLFATGLGALGLLGWRRKRNPGASLLGAAGLTKSQRRRPGKLSATARAAFTLPDQNATLTTSAAEEALQGDAGCARASLAAAGVVPRIHQSDFLFANAAVSRIGFAGARRISLSSIDLSIPIIPPLPQLEGAVTGNGQPCA